MAKRGEVATYPFAIQAPPEYQQRNEERYRASIAQQNADVMDRLSNLELLVAELQAGLAAAIERIEVLEGP